MLFPAKTPLVACGVIPVKIELFYIGMPVVRNTSMPVV